MSFSVDVNQILAWVKIGGYAVTAVVFAWKVPLFCNRVYLHISNFFRDLKVFMQESRAHNTTMEEVAHKAVYNHLHHIEEGIATLNKRFDDAPFVRLVEKND